MKRNSGPFNIFLAAAFVLAAACVPSRRIEPGAPADFNLAISRGLDNLARNEVGGARREFALALQASPGSARAMNLIGLTYFREKNYSVASGWFQRAVQVDPNFAPALINIGAVYSLTGQLERGREALERALKLNPKSVAACASLSSVCFELGDAERGFLCLKQALELDPGFLEKSRSDQAGIPMTRKSLGEMYFAYARFYAARNDRDKTMEMLQKAKDAGFKNWTRLETEKEFEGLRNDQQIREFLKTADPL